MTDLVYALVQVFHNLGAVAVAGGPAVALMLQPLSLTAERRLAFLALAGWALQAATGAGFALASYGLKGALPEVTGIALAAALSALAAAAFLRWYL